MVGDGRSLAQLWKGLLGVEAEGKGRGENSRAMFLGDVHS
jgi:hypothetical protein